MIDIEDLDAKTILSEAVFVELFEIKNKVDWTRRKQELIEKAKTLRVKTQFEELLKVFQEIDKETAEKEKEEVVEKCNALLENYTNFSSCKYNRMLCVGWGVNDCGIYKTVGKEKTTVLVCYQPIIPIEKMKNMETGEEQIRLAYKSNGIWHETNVGRDIVASASKIIGLATIGISVNSENAKMLVKYLCDLENQNADIIPVKHSTSKLGWRNGCFLPYDKKIIFDGDMRFRNLFQSITEYGNIDVWMEHIKSLRTKQRLENRFLMAASFASVLIAPMGALPFIVDLWGETEGGKTVSLMVAASIWGNPNANCYIGDFETTNTALEVKADLLNHLPMFLDDSSKTSSRIRDNFESFVYELCSGKGKSRANKNLGVNRENIWCNTIICNGERPLQSYVHQGGAINRILEVECKENLYDNPAKTVSVVKENYGFAGRLFVEIIKMLGMNKINSIYEDIFKQLMDGSTMKKQSMSLAIILTADRIVTDYIFKDNLYISLDDARSALTEKIIVSDHERCYQFIMDKVAMNMHRFESGTNYEQWGVIDDTYAIFYIAAFDSLCREGGFAKKSFLEWADKKGLLHTQGNQKTRNKKIGGKTFKCIHLSMNRCLDD